MRKDPTEFRKRFAAWKNGKQPYKDGKPVTVGGYEVYPSAVGASELNVTIPEIVVTGKDRRSSWEKMYQNLQKNEVRDPHRKDLKLPWIIGKLVGLEDSQQNRDRMYNTVMPSGYDQDNYDRFYKNEKRPLSSFMEPNLEGVYGLYTNQDSIIANMDRAKDKIMFKHRPLSIKEKLEIQPKSTIPEQYDLAKIAVSDILQRSKYKGGAYEFIHPDGGYYSDFFVSGEPGTSEWSHNHVLGTFKRGTEQDGAGLFDYYSDRWDINPIVGVSSQDDPNFTKRFIDYLDYDDIVPFSRPVEIYGKRYRSLSQNTVQPIKHH